MPKKPTTDADKILVRITGRDPKRQQAFEEEVANRDVARKIYQLREDAGLSQAQLARRVGTTQSVISRLEDADYEGHSLAMLNRIAAALERRVEVSFPKRRRLHLAITVPIRNIPAKTIKKWVAQDEADAAKLKLPVPASHKSLIRNRREAHSRGDLKVVGLPELRKSIRTIPA